MLPRAAPHFMEIEHRTNIFASCRGQWTHSPTIILCFIDAKGDKFPGVRSPGWSPMALEHIWKPSGSAGKHLGGGMWEKPLKRRHLWGGTRGEACGQNIRGDTLRTLCCFVFYLSVHLQCTMDWSLLAPCGIVSVTKMPIGSAFEWMWRAVYVIGKTCKQECPWLKGFPSDVVSVSKNVTGNDIGSQFYTIAVVCRHTTRKYESFNKMMFFCGCPQLPFSKKTQKQNETES